MSRFKDNKTLEQAAEEVLRDYLIRCFSSVSKLYPAIKDMSPEEAADHLLSLRNKNKIQIRLESVGYEIKCQIIPLN